MVFSHKVQEIKPSGFLDGDLFDGQPSQNEAKNTQVDHSERKASLSNKLCPKCGKPGSGPYSRWVENSRHKRYQPYLYFAHRQRKKIQWCYIGKQKKNELKQKNPKVAEALANE